MPALQVTFFTLMEEAIKKALSTGVQTLISVTEEVRHGLIVLEEEVKTLNQKIREANVAESTGAKLDALVTRSLQAVEQYEKQAAEITALFQNFLEKGDSMTRQSVDELLGQVQALAKSIKETSLIGS